MPLHEIAARSGLAPSTARRLLVQLADVGLVVQNDATQRYSLSLQLARLGSIALDAVDVVGIAKPVMADLTDSVGESSFLGRLGGGGVVYLAIVEAQTPIRIALRAGDVRSAHVSSVGKAILASLPDDHLGRWLAEHPLTAITPNAHTTGESLRQDLANVRAVGYALNYRESSLEFASVAAPVRDHTGDVVAAVGVSGPAYRIPPEELTAIGVHVVAAASRVTELLGGSPPRGVSG